MNKKLGYSAMLICLMVSVTVSCEFGIIKNDSADNENEIDTTGLAKVRIPLPKTSSARTVMPEDAKSYTNFFEIAFRNKEKNTYFSASASIEQGYIEATIPPGTYDVLLLAGNRHSPFYLEENLLLLLASSYIQDVFISLEDINIINLPLKVLDVDIIAPKKAVIGDDVELLFIVDTKNPLINYSSISGFAVNLSVDIGFRFNNAGPGTISGAGNITVTHVSSNDCIHKYSYLWKPDNKWGYKSFKSFAFRGRIDLPPSLSRWWFAFEDHPELGQYYTSTIDFVEGADVEINISWQE